MNFGYTIINILKQQKYKISKRKIELMQTFLDRSIILDVNNIVDSKVALVDTQGICYGTIDVLKIPQVVDAPPLCLNNKTIKMLPIVILDMSESKKIAWSVTHEMCHLLSIGEYTHTDNSIYHNFGINEYEYTKSDMKLIKSNVNTCMNELINDYAVWNILNDINGDEIEPIYNGIWKFSQYLEERFTEKIDKNCFIGWYFTGNISNIKNILFDETFKSYEDIIKHLTD